MPTDFSVKSSGKEKLRGKPKVEPLHPAVAAIKARCLYEYMRASGMLREFLEDWEFSAWNENISGLGQAFGTSIGLLIVSLLEDLREARFPAPWGQLSAAARAQLVRSFGVWGMDRKQYPAVIIAREQAQDLSLERVLEGDGESEWSLFKEPSSFYGHIVINPGYTEKETLEAFRAQYRKHCSRTRGGGSAKWQAKLNDLAVLRIRGQFPDDPIQRVQQIAVLPGGGFKCCRDYVKERRKAIREKREVDQRISRAAEAEMSRAYARARAFFQILFPGEEPLNY